MLILINYNGGLKINKQRTRRPTKKVYWKIDEPNLRGALRDGNMEEINTILDQISPEEARNVLNEEMLHHQSYYVQLFFTKIYQKAQKGTYKSDLFKHILNKFMTLIPDEIMDAFYISKIRFMIRNEKIKNEQDKFAYLDQIQDDYNKVQQSFTLADADNTAANADDADLPSLEQAKDSISANSDEANNDSANKCTSHSSLPDIDNDLEDINRNDKQVTYEQAQKDYFYLNILYYMNAWFSQLPAWLKEPILNSTPVSSLIESCQLTALILELKSAGQDFTTKMLYYPVKENNDIEDNKNNLSAKAQIDNEIDKIDMTMVLQEPKINGLILPTATEFSAILGIDDSFSGLTYFFGTNNIDLLQL